MGISNFVTNILSSNNRHSNNDVPSTSTSSTRRVRHIPTPDPLAPSPLKPRRAPRRVRRTDHSPLPTSRPQTPLKNQSNQPKQSTDSEWDSDWAPPGHRFGHQKTASDHLPNQRPHSHFMSPDRETPSNLHRKRPAWRRSQNPRVKSNLESSVQNQSQSGYSSEATSDIDGPPSLRRLFAPRNINNNNKQQQQQQKQRQSQHSQQSDEFDSFGLLSTNATRRNALDSKEKPEHRDDRDGPPSRRRAQGRIRIRSNLDQLMRRDPSVERRVPSGSSRRRHRTISAVDQFQNTIHRRQKQQMPTKPHKVVEPFGLANDDAVVVPDFEHEPETHRGLSVLNPPQKIGADEKEQLHSEHEKPNTNRIRLRSRAKRYSSSKYERSNQQTQPLRPSTPSNRPTTPISHNGVFYKTNNINSSFEAVYAEKSLSPLTPISPSIPDHHTSTSLPPEPRMRQNQRLRPISQDDFLKNEQFPEDSTALETDIDEPRSVIARDTSNRPNLNTKTRFSADAALPRSRVLLGETFSRSQSNPASSSVAVKRGLKKFPPPLVTPVGGGAGFARGIGADRVSAQDPVGRNGINPLIVNSSSSKQASGQYTGIIPLKSRSKLKRSKETKGEDDMFSEGKSQTRFDLWGFDKKSRDSNSFGRRSSIKSLERDQDLFFEEASQSSFGDTDSASRIAARNGIIPMGRPYMQNEIMEDKFVFGSDGRFNDGGFIISSEGLEEAPERVMRKTSDGLAVDGVPPSSNNLIFVRSLDEFRRSYTFKPKVKHGSSTLGRGAAGRVYLAVHNPTGRRIAVKEINVYDQEKRNQLKKELATLISHQSRFLVKSFGAFYDGAGGVHITLEYMDRGSLADIVQQQGKIPEKVMRKIVEHCLRGLCFLHANHILHRDVKTDNILLSRKLCRAKLSDFGLARDLKEGEGISVTDTFVGTLVYMSPERLQGKNYTYGSDIWGLGISILECILGRYPFENPQSLIDILDASQSNLSSLIEGMVSEELVDFICQSMHEEAEKRPRAMDLLDHPWIRAGHDDSNALRDWLDTIPKLHCEDIEVGSELAFQAKAKRDARTKAKLRAKAEEICL